MDPYLERHWEDVHTRLISYIADELQPQLSEDLIARMEEKVFVEAEHERRLRKPDVRIVETEMDWQPGAGTSGTAVLDLPMIHQPLNDPVRRRSVLIYDTDGNRVVTAIEVLSPWNKRRHHDVEAYLKKRREYIESEVSLVEIDLIRVGDWTRMIGPYAVPDKRHTPYRVTVSPAWRALIYHYPIPFDAKLPTIEVPLREGDTAAKLNLQQLLDRAYTMGRYDRIDYSKPCKPPLEGVELDWAEQVIKGAARPSNENR
jgi:hypothetical protein